MSAGEIIKEMGWVALSTRGLPLRIFMIGTLTGLQASHSPLAPCH